MAGRLEGRVVIVTGASRGLGQYCAIAYGAEGARVAVAARTADAAQSRLPGTIHETARLVEEAGGTAMAIACDVADRDAVEAMVAAVAGRWGRVDVLMNNAGILPPGNLSTIEPRHWDLLMRVNVTGTFNGARAVLPVMAGQGGGTIVNISSVAAERAGGGAYHVSKVAVEAFTRALAHEQRDRAIAVNALKPVGAVATPGMYARRLDEFPGLGTPDPLRDRYQEAAVLLALQTVETCTGEVFNDAQAVARFGDAEARARLPAG